MRKYVISQNMTVEYPVSVNPTQQLGNRPSAGSGQRQQAELGLYFYQSRWPAPALLGYDPALGRFAQPDSLVPSGAQGMDRYAYVNNNPVRYNDPTGHQAWKGDGGCVSKFDCAGAKIKTGSGGLYGQPVNVPENDIPDLPDDKPEQIKPVAVRVADATGIAIDVFSYVTYYLLPNFVHVWSANAFYEPLTHTPLDWRIPENIPDTVWKISGVQVVNHSLETIYVTSVRTSQG